jgi:predicted ABC-type ATPase
MVVASGTGVTAIGAGKEVLRLAKEHLKRGESFAIETTLSGKNYLQMMQSARAPDLGFEVVLIYIGTELVEINLARIAKRVLAGGHDAAEMDVRRRCARSLANLPVAAENADQLLLIDNSRELDCRLVGLFGRFVDQWFHPVPAWAEALRTKFP